MKVLQYALIGAICLVIVDKWGQLGWIWPETSRKQPNRSRTVSYLHPSVYKPPSSNVVTFDQWHRKMWSVE